MDVSVWSAFVAATVALLLIPGPTVLLVLSYALGQGQKVAVSTALGVALGDFIAMTLSLFGLGALVLASATLFMVLKWIGAVYLIYLGVSLWRSAFASTLSLPDTKLSHSVFRHACLVTATNPKGIAFFIAFVPQFIDPLQPFVPQAALLIATFVGLAALNALAYALLAARMRDLIRRPTVLSWLTRMGGGVLVTMGVATALIRRTPA